MKQMGCPLIVKDKNDFDNMDIGYCRLDGHACKTHGDWDACRYNLPVVPIIKRGEYHDHNSTPTAY